MFFKILYSFFFIFIFISILPGKTLAIEEITPNYKIIMDKWGNIKIQPELNKTSEIFQTGMYNFSFYLSNDITNFNYIIQSGQFNYSYVKQSGENNKAEIRQKGNNNKAVIKQSLKEKNKRESKGE